MAQELLQEHGEGVMVATNEPSRQLLLAVLQQRGITLTCYDMIDTKGYAPAMVAIEQFWAQMCIVGGPHEVRLACISACICVVGGERTPAAPLPATTKTYARLVLNR